MDDLGGIERWNQLATLGQDERHDVIQRLRQGLLVADVAGCGSEDEVAPKRLLHQDALPLDRMRRRKDDLVGLVALVLVQQEVLTKTGLHVERSVADHVGYLVRVHACAIDHETSLDLLFRKGHPVDASSGTATPDLHGINPICHVLSSSVAHRLGCIATKEALEGGEEQDWSQEGSNSVQHEFR